jgi:tripartite-type tricarboxylate transporter receptor subunit TctC
MLKKLLCILVTTVCVTVQAFTPPKTATVTIAYAPGASHDIAMRKIASILEKENPNNVNFVVSNRPGADETVALNWFTKLEPRGDNLYTAADLVVFMTNEAWRADQARYDPWKMEPVLNLVKSPYCIVASASSTVNTPADLVKRFHTTKTPINVGLGSAAHGIVFGYIMDKISGNNDLIKTIQYKTGVLAAADVAGNILEFAIMPASGALPLIKTGKIKFVSFTSEQRIAQFPDVPLFKDTIPGLVLNASNSLFMPPGTPREQVEYYRNLIAPVLQSSEMQQFMEQNLQFISPAELTSDGVRRAITATKQVWMPYIRKIKLEQ